MTDRDSPTHENLTRLLERMADEAGPPRWDPAAVVTRARRTRLTRRATAATAVLAVGCMAAYAAVLVTDPWGEAGEAAPARGVDPAALLAARPADPPEQCGRQRALGEPARMRWTRADGLELSVVAKGLETGLVTVFDPPRADGVVDSGRHQERTLHVVLEIRASRATDFTTSNFQGNVEVLDGSGRVVGAHPYQTLVGLAHTSMPLQAGVPRATQVSLSSCDPTTVGPPRDARYVRIAGGELPPWLVGTLELP